MSVYTTLEHFYIPMHPLAERYPDEFVGVYVQGVPDHINYTGPDWDFLPPPVPEDSGLYRLVVVCGPVTRKGTERSPQEYQNPLFTLTGEEYARITWDEMWRRLYEVLRLTLEEAQQARNRIARKELEARRTAHEAKQPV
jgi:hypothetical protein